MEDLQGQGGWLVTSVRSEECVYQDLVIVASKIYVYLKFHRFAIAVLG